MRRELDALLSLQRFFAGVLPEPWDVRTTLEGGKLPERPFALIEQSGAAATTGPPVTQDIAIPFTANLYFEKAETAGDAEIAALEVREAVWIAVKWGADASRPTTDLIPLFDYLPRVERHRFKVSGADGGTFTVSIGVHETMPLDPTGTAADLATEIATTTGTASGNVVGYDRGHGLWDIDYVGTLAGTSPGAPTIDGTDLTGAQVVATATTILHAAPAPWRSPSDYMAVSSFGQNTVPDEADATLVMVAVDVRLTFGRGLPLPLERRIMQRVSATAGSGPEA